MAETGFFIPEDLWDEMWLRLRWVQSKMVSEERPSVPSIPITRSVVIVKLVSSLQVAPGRWLGQIYKSDQLYDRTKYPKLQPTDAGVLVDVVSLQNTILSPNAYYLGVIFDQELTTSNPVVVAYDEVGQINSGSGMGSSANCDLMSVTVGPFLYDVTIQCVTNSGTGKTQLQLNKKYKTVTITGCDLTAVTNDYTPGSGGLP